MSDIELVRMICVFLIGFLIIECKLQGMFGFGKKDDDLD